MDRKRQGHFFLQDKKGFGKAYKLSRKADRSRELGGISFWNDIFFFFPSFFQSGRANLSVELVRAKESWRLEPSRIDLKQKEEGGSAGCKRGSCGTALRVCPMKLKTWAPAICRRPRESRVSIGLLPRKNLGSTWGDEAFSCTKNQDRLEHIVSEKLMEWPNLNDVTSEESDHGGQGAPWRGARGQAGGILVGKEDHEERFWFKD